MPDLPAYTWSTSERQFRDARGRFVSRTEVRGAVDVVLDGIASDIRAITQSLVDGTLTIADWHLRMEALVKEAHTSAGAVAAGGWEQATADDWAQIGRKIKFQYQKLRQFARELENGLALDGSIVARAEMYATAGTGTYEAVLRRGDIAAGFDRERRILHSGKPCTRCIAHAARGWQPAGVLPGIGEDCDCLSNCRCTFERKRSVPRTRKSGPMTTAIPAMTFREDRCRKRARIAAVRDGVDAAPLLIHGSNISPGADDRLVFAVGELPSTLSHVDAIDLINLTSAGSDLSPDDVYIHYVEAGNSNFIGDRFMFLDKTTLRNVASKAESGIAFMNSHRTGGLSAPSELPFGRTFAGRYEEFEQGDRSFQRALLGLYMLKGVHPNGKAGPSTDDLHRMIQANTLSDVSLGLVGGMRVCDVCGEDLTAKDDAGKFRCPHAPGTHKGMELAHIEAQTARGVKGGKASYTLVDAMPQEVSAVFKGAVPGAGFRKTLALSKSGALTSLESREARESYSILLERDDRTFFPLRRADFFGGRMDILKAFKFWQAAGEPDQINFETLASHAEPRQVEAPSTPAPKEDPEKVALRAQLEELQAERQRERVDGYVRSAERFADAQVRANRLLPKGKADVIRVHTSLAAADHDQPVADEAGKPWSRLAHYEGLFADRNPHSLTTEAVGTEPVLPPGSRALANSTEPPAANPTLTPERLAAMLSATPAGKAILTTLTPKV